MTDVIKTLVVLSAYFALAPAAGVLLSRHRHWERAALCLLVFMTSWYPSKLTLMLMSVETYRGHTKGFEFSLLVMISIALIVCALVRRPPTSRKLPPGFWLYLAYAALSVVSFIPALNRLFTLMAAWKFTTAALIFAAAFHAMRDADDLRWVLRTMAAMLVLHALVGLKMRYVDGMWQVKGWFEHQNPMAMWAYLSAIPLLAVSFAPQFDQRDTGLFLGGFAAAALLILMSVSRAGLGALAFGAVAVTALAFLRGPSAKKIAITTLGLSGAVAAGLLALDSFAARVSEVKSRDEQEDLRAILNQQSAAMLRDHPFGVGWNNFGIANSLPVEQYSRILMDWDESRGFRIIDENYFANPLTESLYWLQLAETGLPGFLSFAAFCAMTLVWAARDLVAFWKSATGYFVGGLLVALAITYGHGAVERVLTQTKNLSAWLIFAGILARIEFCRRQKQDLWTLPVKTA